MHLQPYLPHQLSDTNAHNAVQPLEFCKNYQREGHILLAGINEITLTCIL